jgi:hypothetical protein
MKGLEQMSLPCAVSAVDNLGVWCRERLEGYDWDKGVDVIIVFYLFIEAQP